MTEQGTNPFAVEPEEKVHAPPTDDKKPEPAAEADDDIEEDETDEIDETEEDDGDETETEDESDETVSLAEVEVNGKKYKIPEEIKDNFLLHRDYTQKRQADAEKAREVETLRTKAEEALKVSEEELRVRGQLSGINQSLEQFKQVNWNAIEQEDPMQAQALWRQHQQLKDSKAEHEKYLETAKTTRDQETQQESAKRVQATQDYVQKNIKGWSPDMDAKIADVLRNEVGISQEQITKNFSPEFYRLAHLAWIGSEAQKRQTKEPKPKPANKPLSKVKGASGPAPSKSIEDMNMHEYADFMNRREKARKSRNSR